MKTYTHPIIKMPAGSVEVKFYDNNKSGEETLPDCIIDIGDVEEGFDYNFGEYNAPVCDFRIWNKNNVIKTMLDTNELKVSVNIDDESYFYGYLNIPSIKPSDNFFYEYTFDAFGGLSFLRRYLILDFYNDLETYIDGPTGFNRFRLFARLMAKHIGLKNFVDNDIEYLCQRKFSWQDGITYKWEDYFLKDVLYYKYYWYKSDTPTNYPNRYDARLDNAYQLLNELKNDFFFYPSIIYDGSDHKLKIMEKDVVIDDIESPLVKGRRKETNYFMNQLVVDLLNRPDAMDSTGLKYDSGYNGNVYGELVEFFMKHTNIIRAYEDPEGKDSFSTQMRMYVPDSGSNDAKFINRVSNNSLSKYNDFSSLQEAFYYAIKDLYYNNVNWERLTVKGLKGTQNNVSKMEYLMPAYRFPYDSNNYYIHSVKKSLKRNETEVLGLIVSKDAV